MLPMNRDKLIDDAAECASKIAEIIENYLKTLTPGERQARRDALHAVVKNAVDSESLNVIDIMRQKQGDQSIRKFAASLKCSASYVSAVYSGERTAGPKLLKALEVVKETSLKKWR